MCKRKQKMKGNIILGFLILDVLYLGGMANGICLNQSIQPEPIMMDLGDSVEWTLHASANYPFDSFIEPLEDGPDTPDDRLPLIDEGNDITTAAGLAEYYGIDTSEIRGILPDWIPTTDRILFEAYTKLFEQTTPINFGPNGLYQTSGSILGMFIAEQKISIDWEDKNIVDCGTNGLACVDRNNPDPGLAATIFVVEIGYSPINIADIYAGKIAHEAFHLTFPYGTVNSKLEEMDAVRIGSIIVGPNTPDVYETPNYSAEAIYNWVAGYCSNIYGPCSYENLPLYPNHMMKAVFTTSTED